MNDDKTAKDHVDEGFEKIKGHLRVAVNNLIGAGVGIEKSIELNVGFAHTLVTEWVIESKVHPTPTKMYLLATRLLKEVGQEAIEKYIHTKSSLRKAE